jgi:hypothetical protein
MKHPLLLILLLPLFSSAQLTKKDSLWLPFASFLGEWKGTGEGANGTGIYERSYKQVLNKNYIEVRNKTVYAPNEKAKNGYTHEDVGYISYDKMRKTFIFRQFHGEGFVNEYKLDSISTDKKTIVFISETIENIPAGWRAKEVYTISDKGIREVFYLAQPGKEFEEYTKANLEMKLR